MNSLDCNTEGIDTLKKKYTECADELKRLMQPDAATNIWLDELAKLDDIVLRARKEGWGAWEPKRNWT
jgi:hypothetical protein